MKKNPENILNEKLIFDKKTENVDKMSNQQEYAEKIGINIHSLPATISQEEKNSQIPKVSPSIISKLSLINSEISYLSSQNDYMLKKIEDIFSSDLPKDVEKILDEELSQQMEGIVKFFHEKIERNHLKIKSLRSKKNNHEFFAKRYNEVSRDMGYIYEKSIDQTAILNAADFEKIDIFTSDDIANLSQYFGDQDLAGEAMTKSLQDTLEKKYSKQSHEVVLQISQNFDLIDEEVLFSSNIDLSKKENIISFFDNRINNEFRALSKYLWHKSITKTFDEKLDDIKTNEEMMRKLNEFSKEFVILKTINLTNDILDQKFRLCFDQTETSEVNENYLKINNWYGRLKEIFFKKASVKKESLIEYCTNFIKFLSSRNMINKLKEEIRNNNGLPSKIVLPGEKEEYEINVADFMVVSNKIIKELKDESFVANKQLTSSLDFDKNIKNQNQVNIWSTRLDLYKQEDGGELVINKIFKQ